MKLWDAMQRIERCRYEAEIIAARAADCPPELRGMLAAMEREWLHLAAQTHAIFEGRDPPRLDLRRFEPESAEQP